MAKESPCSWAARRRVGSATALGLALVILASACATGTGDAAIERDCARLSLRYAQLIDLGDRAAVADLFTPDGTWETTTSRSEGRAAIAKALAALGPVRTRHVITNQLVFREEGARARGIAYFTLYAANEGSSDLSGQPIMVGIYEDEYALTPDGCRFRSRKSSASFKR